MLKYADSVQCACAASSLWQPAKKIQNARNTSYSYRLAPDIVRVHTYRVIWMELQKSHEYEIILLAVSRAAGQRAEV